MSNLFQKVEQQAFRAGITPRSRESREWFRKKVQNMQVNRRALMKEDPIDRQSASTGRNKAVIGKMAMFFYDAKHRDTLPYWDAFPLVIIAGPAPKGFYGLNLHYLPIALRAKFLDSLMNYTTDNNYDEDTRLGITYRMLKNTSRLRYFQPCFKHYLTSQVEQNIAFVSAPEWEIATFLPTAQWRGGGQSVAYKNTREIISGI